MQIDISTSASGRRVRTITKSFEPFAFHCNGKVRPIFSVDPGVNIVFMNMRPSTAGLMMKQMAIVRRIRAGSATKA